MIYMNLGDRLSAFNNSSPASVRHAWMNAGAVLCRKDPIPQPPPAQLRHKLGYSFLISVSAASRPHSVHATPALLQMAFGPRNAGTCYHRRGYLRARRYRSRTADFTDPSHRDSLDSLQEPGRSCRTSRLDL